MAEVLVDEGVALHVQRLAPTGGEDALASSRPLVVFLHGLVMDNLSSWYFTVATRASRDNPVLLYDLRGHGRSERPPTGYTLDDMVDDLGDLLDAEGADEPVELVGNSFGGTLALAFAARHPDRVSGLALVDAGHSAAGWGRRMAETLRLTGEARAQAIAENFQSWLGRHSKRKRTRLADTALGLVEGTSLVDDLERSHDLTPRELRDIACPALLVYGEASDVIDDGRALASALPDATLEVLPGCSHSVLWEATDHLRDRLLAWLARP